MMNNRNNSESSEDVKEALKRLAQIQEVGQMLYQQEADRLTLKYGVADARARRAVEKAQGAQNALNALERETEAQVDKEQVKPAEGESVVYGRVVADDARGISGVEVALEDTNGRVMRAAGTATTDSSGRYVLRVPAAVAEKLADKEYVLTGRGAKGEVLYRAENTLTLKRDEALMASARISLPASRRPPVTIKPETSAAETPTRSAEPFVVTGRVVDAKGKPAAGLLVRIYDKDVRYDDLLGAALTNADGVFRAQYRRQDFDDGGEKGADLYFVVVNHEEQVLLSSADRVLFNSERTADVTLELTGETPKKTRSAKQ
jgi:5-hydroxyisourate hydrolase-like protein (transthyretin family)